MASPTQWTRIQQTLGDSEEQGSLACCSPCSGKESDMTQKLNNKGNASQRLSFPERCWKCVMDISTNSYLFWKMSSSLPSSTSEDCLNRELMSQPPPSPLTKAAAEPPVIGRRQTAGSANCTFSGGEVHHQTYTLPSGPHSCSFHKYLLFSIQVHSLLVFSVEFPIPVAS